MTQPLTHPAGSFAEWRAHLLQALAEGSGTDVPCGSCTGCCRGSFFIHIGPDESETLKHIPKALLFPAPGLPAGHVLMGYNEHGACPMLRTEGCTIYAHRPRTCRLFDCRAFAAAGFGASEGISPPVMERVSKWTFDAQDEDGLRALEAVRRAGRFILAQRDHFPLPHRPRGATEMALMALRVHECFLEISDAQLADMGHEEVDRLIRAMVKVCEGPQA